MTPRQGGYSEDQSIEQPAIKLLMDLGWDAKNCYQEFEQGGGSFLQRENKSEVILKIKLSSALKKLNPTIPTEVFEEVISEIGRDRSRLSPASANLEIYRLIKDGVKVSVSDPHGEGRTNEVIKVVDWDNPLNNDFFVASQLWVTGEMYTRRTDLVGFVNGIPLVFIELKASHRRLENAFYGNLRDYKDTIPQLFWYNALVILSNGSQSKIGSITADWDHFSDWKKINSEGEKGIISLDTMIRGTCEPSRLLDLIENYTLFMEMQGSFVKVLGKNHQLLGVSNAIQALKDIKTRKGKLGVFWHTQGSGKSISMIFFSQKILRKVPGNWTFVIVTDRKELDKQIYKNFVSGGAITEAEAHAGSCSHLRQLLNEDHRFIFTLIHKFDTTEKVTDRSDIIVITDESHRSQYDALAMNMRTALPNASFIAFTGTPLIAGEEEKTKQVFGDYVSIYDFKQSIEDKATVPLFYENRIPELQLTNQNLNQDLENVLEIAELNEAEERKLEREFAREYHLITRDDRLETISKDIVTHFMARGFQGKAMVVSIDKATAVKMYDKVKKYWDQYFEDLKVKLSKAKGTDKEALAQKIAYMKETGMAVVVSQGQNEVHEMRTKGVEIEPHRRRMNEEDLDTKFKKSNDPFRIVFVCAMWMTGFDVPSCSTIYLDKPMRNHTLMQTIARANRVFKDKVNGLIVDYVGVFRNLEQALAIYGKGEDGKKPALSKGELVAQLKGLVVECKKVCKDLGIDLEPMKAAEGFDLVLLLDNAVELILSTDESKKRFLTLAGNIRRYYKAILPDPLARDFSADVKLIHVIAQKILCLGGDGEVDITEVLAQVEDILDKSIATEGYVIREPGPLLGKDRIIDLSKVNFDVLKKRFENGRKHIEVERLKNKLGRVVYQMVQLNRTRKDYLEQFQQMIEEYNSGSANVDEFFKRLIEFSKTLKEEEKRAVAESLSEDELAIFDILTKPNIKMTDKEKKKVKNAAKSLLNKLKKEKLVLDWRKRQQSRADVRVAIEETLDQELPLVYSPEIFRNKCDAVYQHVFESYFGLDKSIYEAA